MVSIFRKMWKVLSSSSFFSFVLVFIFILVIISSFWRYYYTKNYDFMVEDSCDPKKEKCYFRDCENNPDSCPPNGLSYYKVLKVKAYDFPECADSSCDNECKLGKIKCENVTCGMSEDDRCDGPTK